MGPAGQLGMAQMVVRARRGDARVGRARSTGKDANWKRARMPNGSTAHPGRLLPACSAPARWDDAARCGDPRLTTPSMIATAMIGTAITSPPERSGPDWFGKVATRASAR